MHLFGQQPLAVLLSLSSVVAGFANLHNGHAGLHKRCPYAQAQEDGGAVHDKRFLFDNMKDPVDSMSFWIWGMNSH